jgi:hypothetical protein
MDTGSLLVILIKIPSAIMTRRLATTVLLAPHQRVRSFHRQSQSSPNFLCRKEGDDVHASLTNPRHIILKKKAEIPRPVSFLVHINISKDKCHSSCLHEIKASIPSQQTLRMSSSLPYLFFREEEIRKVCRVSARAFSQ